MELLKLDFEQTMLRFVDVRMMLLLRNRHQTTVELIGPTVIRATNDALARSASLQHSRCAVSANVLECAQLFIFAAHNENVIAANIVRDEIAYSRHFIDMANELPAIGDFITRTNNRPWNCSSWTSSKPCLDLSTFE